LSIKKFIDIVISSKPKKVVDEDLNDINENHLLNLSKKQKLDKMEKDLLEAKVETDIFTKARDILKDIVPHDIECGNHMESIDSAIRLFFQRFDYHRKGYVLEECFYTFSRRSGLQERLSKIEYRRLLDKLRKKRINENDNISMINYDKFCRKMILLSCDDNKNISKPYSEAEAVLYRIKDAAFTSSLQDRNFLELCKKIKKLLYSNNINYSFLFHFFN
jgi:glutamyl/glutaminyl-tRNA synthetase